MENKKNISFQQVMSSARHIINQMVSEGVENTLLKDEIKKMLLVEANDQSTAGMVAALAPDDLRIESLRILKDLPYEIRRDMLHIYAKRGSDNLQLEMLKEPEQLALLKDGLTVAYRIGRHASSVAVLKKMANDEIISALENDDGSNVNFVLAGKLARRDLKAILPEARKRANELKELANNAKR
jgi:hypothetical protein